MPEPFERKNPARSEMTTTWPTKRTNFANIHIDGKHVLSIGLLDNGKYVLYAPDEFENVEMAAEPLVKYGAHLVPLRRILKLDAGFDTEEEEERMALPNGEGVMRRTVIAGEPIRSRGLFGHSDDERGLISGSRVLDPVLEAILDSLIDHPNQISSFRAAETRRIAEEFGVRMYAVAGVRAALTKGIYGDTAENLVKARRALRQRIAPEAAPQPRRIGVRT